MIEEKKLRWLAKKTMIGWREMVSLPELRVPRIKAKIDTGARTSALHVSHAQIIKRGKKKRVKFIIHPIQHSAEYEIKAEADYIEERVIRSSTGHFSSRPVIRTELILGGERIEIELTLVNRDLMGFRMLIGRQALRKQFLVHAGRSFLSKSEKAQK